MMNTTTHQIHPCAWDGIINNGRHCRAFATFLGWSNCCPAASALVPTGHHPSPQPARIGIKFWGLGMFFVECTSLNDSGKHTCTVHLCMWRFMWCQHIPGIRTPCMLLSGTQTSIFQSQQRQCQTVWTGWHGHHLGFPGKVGQKLQTESLLIPFRGTGGDTIREGHWWWCCLLTHIDTCSRWQGKWRAVRCWNVLYVTLCVLLFPKLEQCPLATDRWLLVTFCASGQVLL